MIKPSSTVPSSVLNRLSLRSRRSNDADTEEVGGRSQFTLVQHVDYDSRRLRSHEARWESEKSATGGFQKGLEQVVESAWLEVLVSTCVVADLTLTIMSFVISEEAAESDAMFILSAIFLIVLLLDVILRIIKDKIRFFVMPLKVLNWIEFVVGIGGVVMLVLDAIRRSCSGDGCSRGGQAKGASLGRSIRPILRTSRVLRATSQILLSRGGIHKKIDRATDAMTDHMVRQAIGGMLILPSENVTLKPSAGMFHVEKAQVRSDAFKGLHIPFTILGGIIDLFHVDLDLFAITAHRRRDHMSHTGHRLLIVVENVLLVMGPGHHQEPPAPPWDFEAVQEGKGRLVDFVMSKFMQFVKQPEGRNEDGAQEQPLSPPVQSSSNRSTWAAISRGALPQRPNMRESRKKAIDAVKKKLQLAIGEVLAHGMHVSIKHVEIRYEDAEGCLSGGPTVVGGLKVCSGQIRAQGAMEEEHPDDYIEEDFRVRGKWLSTTPSFASERETRNFQETPSGKSARESASSVKQLNSTDPVSSKSSKRHLSHGVRMAAELHNIAAFWDLYEALPCDDNKLFAPKLQEGKGADLKSFLKKRRQADCRERLRLAVCNEVERTWFKTQGKSALERMRKLRERVSAHRYLVIPSSCSVHAVVKPPAPGAPLPKVAGMEHWPVTTDIDVHVPRVPFSVDLNQAHTLVRLLDYVKRWNREDNRIMWQPPPHHEGRQLAFVRWGYALRQVLHGIDDTYPWHVLAWIEMRRRAMIHKEYLTELCAPPPLDTEKIAVLQVALPIAEVLLARQAALQGSQKLQRQRSNSERIKSRCGAFRRCMPGMSRRKPVDDGDSDDVSLRVETAKELIEQEEALVKELEEKVERAPIAARAAQIFVRVGLMQAQLLSRSRLNSIEPRRQLLRCESRGLSMVGVRCAPRKIWIQICPPKVLEACPDADELVPEDWVIEVSVKDMRAVLCSAPSSAPRLRRLLSFTRIPDDDVQELPVRPEVGDLVGAAAEYEGGDASYALRDAASMQKRVSIASMATIEEEPLAIQVLIKNASALRNADHTHGFSDPYCICRYRGKPETEWRTRTLKDTLTPVWYQSMRMQPPEHGDMLEFSVRDHDDVKFGDDDFLGHVELKKHMFVPDGFEGRLFLKQKDGSMRGNLEVKISIDHGLEAENVDDKHPVMQVRGAVLRSNYADEAKVPLAVRDAPRWIISAWTMPVEVYVLKPFIQQLATHFKVPPTPNTRRPFLQRKGSHLPHDMISSQAMTDHEKDMFAFWLYLDERKKIHAATTIAREKKQRKNERIMGLSGPVAGKRIEGEVLLRGGMHATRLQMYTKACWLAECATLPPGVMKGHRQLAPAGVKTGYKPLATVENGSNGNEDRSRPITFQASNGWWFATEAEAKMASEVLNTGSLPAGPKQDGDISCAGVDAYEEKEPLFTLPETALSTWMPTYDKLNKNFSYRYKPHTSAHGLLQLPPSPLSRRQGREVCPAPLVECCGCSSTAHVGPVAQIAADKAKAKGGEAGTIEEQQRERLLSPRQERDPSRNLGFVPPSSPSAIQSGERAGLTNTAGKVLHTPTPQAGLDLGNSISAQYQVLSSKEVGLPVPARLQELWEVMGVSDAVSVG